LVSVQAEAGGVSVIPVLLFPPTEITIVKQNSRCLTHRLVRESFAENLQGGDSSLARIGMKLLETTIL